MGNSSLVNHDGLYFLASVRSTSVYIKLNWMSHTNRQNLTRVPSVKKQQERRVNVQLQETSACFGFERAKTRYGNARGCTTNSLLGVSTWVKNPPPNAREKTTAALHSLLKFQSKHAGSNQKARSSPPRFPAKGNFLLADVGLRSTLSCFAGQGGSIRSVRLGCWRQNAIRGFRSSQPELPQGPAEKNCNKVSISKFIIMLWWMFLPFEAYGHGIKRGFFVRDNELTSELLANPRHFKCLKKTELGGF